MSECFKKLKAANFLLTIQKKHVEEIFHFLDYEFNATISYQLSDQSNVTYSGCFFEKHNFNFPGKSIIFLVFALCFNRSCVMFIY